MWQIHPSVPIMGTFAADGVKARKQRGAKKKLKNVMIQWWSMQLYSGWSPRRLLLLDFQIAKCRQESLSDWKLQKINGGSTRSLSIEPWVIFPGLFLNFNLNTNSGVAHAFMSLVQSSVKKPVGRQSSYHRLPRLQLTAVRTSLPV